MWFWVQFSRLQYVSTEFVAKLSLIAASVRWSLYWLIIINSHSLDKSHHHHHHHHNDYDANNDSGDDDDNDDDNNNSSNNNSNDSDDSVDNNIYKMQFQIVKKVTYCVANHLQNVFSPDSVNKVCPW